VANTGNRKGEEVVQLYVSDPVASVARPERQLIGFARVALDPGAAARVTFSVHPSRLAFYDEQMDFVVEEGELTFATGSSAGDLRCEGSIWLKGGTAAYSQRTIVPVTAKVSGAVSMAEAGGS